MTSQPSHRHFGTPLSDWMAAVPNELEIDAVGLWQIVPALRKAFGLSDVALERAVRDTLNLLLAREALPVVGSSTRNGTWEAVDRYGNDPTAIADAVVAEWQAMARDPDVGDVWFAHPSLLSQPDLLDPDAV